MSTLPHADLLAHAPWGASIPAALAVGLLAGALALDWWGIGHQADRDRITAVLAAVGMWILACVTGWPGAVDVPSWCAALCTALLITAGAAVWGTLEASRRASMRRPVGRIAVQTWLAVAAAVTLFPCSILWPLARVAAWPVGRPSPALGLALAAITAGWWLTAAGVRPWLLLTSPDRGPVAAAFVANARRTREAFANARERVRTVIRGSVRSDSGVTAMTVFGRSAAFGRSSNAAGEASPQVTAPNAEADAFDEQGSGAFVEHGAAVAVNAGERQTLAPTAVEPAWRSVWRAMLAWAPPDARSNASAVDADRSLRARMQRAWLERQLDQGASPTAIVRAARAHWGGSEATWWRHLRRARADRSLRSAVLPPR